MQDHVKRDGYAESVRIPKAPPEIVESTIREAVRAGTAWLTSGPASIFREEIPPGVLTGAAV